MAEHPQRYSYRPVVSKEQVRGKLGLIKTRPTNTLLFEAIADEVATLGGLDSGNSDDPDRRIYIQGRDNHPIELELGLTRRNAWRTFSSAWGPRYYHTFVDRGQSVIHMRGYEPTGPNQSYRAQMLDLVADLLHGLDLPLLDKPTG